MRSSRSTSWLQCRARTPFPYGRPEPILGLPERGRRSPWIRAEVPFRSEARGPMLMSVARTNHSGRQNRWRSQSSAPAISPGIRTRALAGGHTVTLLGTEADKSAGARGRAVRGRPGRHRGRHDQQRGSGARGLVPSARRRPRPLWRPIRRQDCHRYHEPGRPGDVRAAHDRSRFGRSGDRFRAPDAKVVKAFNTTLAGSPVEGQVAGQPLDVFVPPKR